MTAADPAATRPVRPRRWRSISVLGLLVGGAAALGASTQAWFTVQRAVGDPLDVTGSTAAPTVSALGLTVLAAAGALTLAPRVLRLVLGVVAIALAVGIVVASIQVASDAFAAVSPSVTRATGLSGRQAIREAVSAIDASAWPQVAVVGGVVAGLAGLLVLVTGWGWPASGRRYRAVTPERSPASGTARSTAADADDTDAGVRSGDGATTGPGSTSAAEEWDALSRGADPTDDEAGDGPGGRSTGRAR